MYCVQVFNNDTGERLLTLVDSDDQDVSEELAINFHLSGYRNNGQYTVVESIRIILDDEKDLLCRIIPYKVNFK